MFDYDIGEWEVFLKEGDDWCILFVYNVMFDKGEYLVGFVKDLNIFYFKGYKGDFCVLYILNFIINEWIEVYVDEGYDVNGSFIYLLVIWDVIGVCYDGWYYWDECYVVF